MTMNATHRGAGIVFRAKTGEALFLKRGPTGDYPGYWCFPGGHVDAGEDAEAAATREAVEEIGHLPKGKRAVIARSIMAQELPALPPAGAADAAAPPVALPAGAAAEAAKVVDYTTFLQDVPEPFDVVRDREHVGHAWAPLSSPPEPLHPGSRVVVDRLMSDELGVARMMAASLLTSPQKYQNVMLWAMRITGTGVSYRAPVLKLDKDGRVVKGDDGKAIVDREEEFPWRDPSIYLNDEFLARCNGLPVIWKHPKKTATLNSEEFEDRIVGTIFLPFIRGDEVWGIAKVYDAAANDSLERGTEEGKDWSTSPSVVLSDPNNPSYKFRLEDGSLLLVEGKPSLLDHLAICERGVWDKGGEPAGIINDSLEGGEHRMTTEVKKEPTMAEVMAAIGSIGNLVDGALKDIGARVDALEAKKDAAGGGTEVKDPHNSGKADGETTPPASREDSHGLHRKDGESEDDFKKRCDSMARRDGESEKDHKERCDAVRKDDSEAEEAREKAKKDADGEAERVAADAKKDAEEARKDAAAARAENTELRTRLAAVESKLPQDRSDDDHRTMSAAQARADSVYELFGKHAPRFQNGEGIGEYRRRLVREFAQYSPEWKAVDVGALPDAAFAVAEERIYADAAVAARDAVGVEDGGLRMVPGTTGAGHKTIEYYGRPSAWMGRFGGARRFATSIRPNTSKREAL